MFQSPLSTHLFVERYLQDLAISSPVKQKLGTGSAKDHPKWIPPKNGCVKINVDAAVGVRGIGNPR